MAALGLAGALPAAATHKPGDEPTYTWPEFHENPQLTGVTNDPSISTANAADLGVSWMTNTGALSLGSPVVGWNAALGETLAYAVNDAGYLIAYNQATGLPVWSDQMGAPIRSTPLIDGAYVWLGVNAGTRLYKLDAATGATVCSAGVGNASGELIDSEPTLFTPPGGSPTVVIGVNSGPTKDGPVTAVNESNCTVDWSVAYLTAPTPSGPNGGTWTPISYGVDASGEPLVFFGTSDPDAALYAVDALTGNLVWSYSTYNPGSGPGGRGAVDVGAGLTVSAPGVNGFADGVVYGLNKGGYLYAMDMTTGAVDWQVAYNGSTTAGGIPTPALDGTQLVFGNGADVICLNAVTGDLEWETPVNGFDSSPLIMGPSGEQVVVFGGLDGGVYVLSLATGAQLYSYQTGDFITASPADVDGNIVISSGDGYLYDFAVGGGTSAAPATDVVSPANSATVPNPNGDLTVSGTASSGTPIGAVNLAIQEGGTSGLWWDSATSTWTVAPYPNPATLTAAGTTQTGWTLNIPIAQGGGQLEVLSSAVNDDGVADISAEQSSPTEARSTFSVSASTTAPTITSSVAYVGPGQKFTVNGHGFADGESVELTVGSVKIATLKASKKGVIKSTSVDVPAGHGFGPEGLVATGETSGLKTSAPLYLTNTWNQYHQGSLRQGEDPDDTALYTHLSVSNSSFLNQAWSFTASGAVDGSPAIVDGVAYIADDAGDVYAINIETGMEIWTYNDGDSAIDDTPAVAGGDVIVGTAAGTVIAINATTGTLAWTSTLGGGAVDSSPAVVGSTIYVASENANLYALLVANGDQVWSATLGGASQSSPAVDPTAGLVIVGDRSGLISAFSESTGSPVWTYTTGGAVTAAPLISGGTVYVGSADDNLYALAESTGDLSWEYNTNGAVTASATLNNLGVEVGSSDGSLFFLDPANGSVAYQLSMEGPVVGISGATGFTATETSNGYIQGSKPEASDGYAWKSEPGGDFASTPVVVNGEIYTTGVNGALTCYTIPTHPAV
jgi:outer membrane protein assembly factor BamB